VIPSFFVDVIDAQIGPIQGQTAFGGVSESEFGKNEFHDGDTAWPKDAAAFH